jgi:2-dehydro-3-deoxyphosphooctonate aldolase (KDO 8-P synthase)
VSDLTAIPIMRRFGYPVIYDATHSVQAPGGRGDSSGGNREFVEPLAMSAVVCGADALFLEVHEDPTLAMSDGPNMLALKDLENFLKKIKRIESALKKG